MTFFRVWKICYSSEISVEQYHTFERECICNEGNLTWKIINREVSEPSGLAGLISAGKEMFGRFVKKRDHNNEVSVLAR